MTVLDAPAPIAPAAVAPAPAAPATAARPALPVLTVTEPLPGFPGYREYALLEAVPASAGQGLVCWLQSVDPAGPRFLAVAAASFFPDYAPALPRGVRGELGLTEDAEPELYCIVTVPDGDVGRATANLRAPLVVHAVAGLARQVVLHDGDHPIRRPLRR
jgi:flagellar assembly factor FliW